MRSHEPWYRSTKKLYSWLAKLLMWIWMWMLWILTVRMVPLLSIQALAQNRVTAYFRHWGTCFPCVRGVCGLVSPYWERFGWCAACLCVHTWCLLCIFMNCNLGSPQGSKGLGTYSFVCVHAQFCVALCGSAIPSPLPNFLRAVACGVLSVRIVGGLVWGSEV
jgi:hypothetical protein